MKHSTVQPYKVVINEVALLFFLLSSPESSPFHFDEPFLSPPFHLDEPVLSPVSTYAQHSGQAAVSSQIGCFDRFGGGGGEHREGGTITDS